MTKQPKVKFVRVSKWTHEQLIKKLTEMITESGNPNLSIGDVIETMLKIAQEKEEKRSD